MRGSLPCSVRVLRSRPSPTGEIDWELIDWKYRVVQGLARFLGGYPDILRKRGELRVEKWRRTPSGSGIDLIPAVFSDKTSSTGEEEGDKRKERKKERARRRLERYIRGCGKTGHVESHLSDEGVEGRYHPHTCHSVFCSYCAWVQFRRTYARHVDVFEQWLRAGKRLAFITLTCPSSHNPEEAIETAFALVDKLYHWRVGPRNLKKLKRETIREIRAYNRNLKAKGDPDRKEKVKRQIEFTRQFFAHLERYAGNGYKFGQLINAIVKFELTYSEEHGFHPHFHIIADLFVPKVVLTALSRIVGFGEVSDIRAISGMGGLAELTKYVTKHWELDGLSEEQKVELEGALMFRKKFRVWGFELLDLEEESEVKKEERVHLPHMRVEIEKPNLSGVPALARKAKRTGKPQKYCDAEIRDELGGGVWDAELYVYPDGSLRLHCDDPSYKERLRAYASASPLRPPPVGEEDDYG